MDEQHVAPETAMQVHDPGAEPETVAQTSPPPHQPEPVKLLSRRHPTRWLTGFIALAAVAAICFAFANAQIDWRVTAHFLTAGLILNGFEHTIIISFLAMASGLVLGTVFAVMRLSSNPVTSGIAWLYVWLFRGTPVFLQLLIWFNLALVFPAIGIPGLVHARTVNVITPFVAALLGLGINEGAYLTEIIRGGILSVDRGQTEAALTLGVSQRQALARIVLPQAMPAILPTIGNETIGMMKTSALAAVISYSELLNRAESIYYVNGNVMELLFVAAFWYLLATTVTSIGQYYLEQHFGRSQARRQSIADKIIRAVILRMRRAAT